MNKLYLILYLLLFSIFLNSEPKNEFRIYPNFSYSEQTSLRFGSVLFLYKYDKNNKLIATNDTNITYTLKKQFAIYINSERYFKHFDLIWDFDYEDFPKDFYEIGKYSSDSSKESFNSKRLEFCPEINYKLKDNFSLGSQISIKKFIVTEKNSDSSLNTILGGNGGFCAGLALVLKFDYRNNKIFPTEGTFTKILLGRFDKFFGSEFNYNSFEFDFRKYIEIKDDHIIAFNLLSKNRSGKIPFQDLYSFGDSDRMRGYPSDRYIDEKIWAFQNDYRFPLFWRFRSTIFYSLGNISDKFDSSLLEKIRIAYGIGLRFKLFKEKKMSLRLDFGFSDPREKKSSLYISVNEAF